MDFMVIGCEDILRERERELKDKGPTKMHIGFFHF
jgi:hypothetical protein